MSVTIATGSSVDLPIGSIIWYAAPVQPDKADSIYIPNGYLYCDGSSLKKVDYEDLYNRIGNYYNTSSTKEGEFNIPDLRDKFIIGYHYYSDTTKRKIGTTEQGNIQSHTHALEIVKEVPPGKSAEENIIIQGKAEMHKHNITFGTANVNYSAAGNLTVLTAVGGTGSVTKSTTNVSDLPVDTQINDIVYKVKSTGGSETRPRNMNFIPIIKY